MPSVTLSELPPRTPVIVESVEDVCDALVGDAEQVGGPEPRRQVTKGARGGGTRTLAQRRRRPSTIPSGGKRRYGGLRRPFGAGEGGGHGESLRESKRMW